MERATEADAGCWVEGHWGQYALARAILKAHDWGFDQVGDLVNLAERHLDSMGPSDSPGITDDEHEYMSDSADEVEGWLNDNIAPEGYSFGWHDGEFFLWPNSEWELI